MRASEEQGRVGGRSPAALDEHTSAGQRPPRAVALVLLARFVVAVVVTAWIAVLSPALFGLGSTTVMSDSMAPGVLAGDAVVVRPATAHEVRLGDVLLVEDPDRTERLRLHRLVGREQGGLVLKGDANGSPDASIVLPGHVRGVAVLRVPFAGLPDYWLHTGAVLPLALVVVALLGLGLVACLDVRPPPDMPPRPARLVRLLRPWTRRAVGVRALVLVVVASGTAVGGGHDHGWATFTGIASSNSNAIGASSLFTNCPAWPAGLPTPFLRYAYTAISGTTEQDVAGNNDGSVSGVTRQAGFCDGTAPTPYLSLSSSTSTSAVFQNVRVNTPSTDFSISLWMNPSNAGTGILADFTNSNGTGNQNVTDRQIYYKTDGTLAFGARFGSGTGTPVTCVAAAPASGSWHHVVGTATAAGVLTLYVDGVSACTVTGAGGYASNAALAGGFWAFGAENAISAAAWGESTTATGFVGGLDETAVFSTALTATDVTNLFNAGH